MNRISVALSNVPGLLRDIVTDAIAAAPDIDIAGIAESEEALEALLHGCPPAVIIAAERDLDLARRSRNRLAKRALPRLLVLTHSGLNASLYWLQPRVRPLGQLTPDALVREIRKAAALETDWHAAKKEES